MARHRATTHRLRNTGPCCIRLLIRLLCLPDGSNSDLWFFGKENEHLVCGIVIVGNQNNLEQNSFNKFRNETQLPEL